jgi:flagellar protein FlaG
MSAEITPVMAKDVAAVAAPAAAEVRPAVTVTKQTAEATAQESREALRAALKDLNHEMAQSKKGLHFSMDERLGRSIITVENANTGKVIRQIPDPAALKVAHNIEQLKGVLLDEDI